MNGLIDDVCLQGYQRDRVASTLYAEDLGLGSHVECTTGRIVPI
jgi:hypothetical protein